ncbi:uncharacterized protein LOC131044500 isoform X2 [Cryptomeria japonica]|uniref:uncharacterized protein LOC131044500 isoform X2 n=1 Tax=Cryptomeria japonica TaxID=3369 RepID=UPI0025AD7DED|nr:uncharacterized protein LOC131044500 isoform X2 [Cryptomeria japonica]
MGLLRCTPSQFNCTSFVVKFMVWSPRTRFFSSIKGDLNAYEILGVANNCSDVEIKAAFRKLAKETHPDLHIHLQADFLKDRFVHILAAYEILSDPQKRAQYDADLLLQRHMDEKQFKNHPNIYTHDIIYDNCSRMQHMEVVEWLKWYRHAVNDIVSRTEIGVGSGLREYLEGEIHSAIRAAYFGPSIESTYTLPDCFEAEERSDSTVSEVLHLVSGRHLFGVVCFADTFINLPHEPSSNATCFPSYTMPIYPSMEQMSTKEKLERANQQVFSENNAEVPNHLKDTYPLQVEKESLKINQLDAYKDLEIHLFGKVVARATRVPPAQFHGSNQGKDSQDCISVFLEVDQTTSHTEQSYSVGSDSKTAVHGSSKVLIGTIYGLGTTSSEGTCFIHGADGKKSHMIVLHRTPLVKHMYWYDVGQENSACECRCTRARLPPSKFWIFEPRCEKHDIGGWYVETFGRDKKGKTIPFGRHWQSLNYYDGSKFMGRSSHQSSRGKLHPAMYTMVLAYRTLDLEAAQGQKTLMGGILKTNIDLTSMTSNLLLWCKRKLPFIKFF